MVVTNGNLKIVELLKPYGRFISSIHKPDGQPANQAQFLKLWTAGRLGYLNRVEFQIVCSLLIS